MGIATLSHAVDSKDHTCGPEAPGVSLVEYGDYTSLLCAKMHKVVQTVLEQLDQRVRFTYRHFALTHVHPRSYRAAEAAEAAGSQGRFWDMHDALFARPGEMSDGHLVERAEALRLDTRHFLWHLSRHVHAQRILAHTRSALASGVDSTPVFFVNGSRLPENWSTKALVDALVTAASAAEGTTGSTSLTDRQTNGTPPRSAGGRGGDALRRPRSGRADDTH